ncbi:hypothetical protein VDGD_06175 [Verticillium dahliae]|nr:hypothetical protein VDGD_06175 [Verticillium dahliae]
MAEEVDVLILGAGLSGINAAYRVRTELPNASLAVLEGRDILGGTWSFWKYPGFRCDAAMTNFGFHWHPWTHERKIIEGERIIEYVEDAVRTHGIDKHIRFGHRILSADWHSATARWTVEVDHGGQRKRFRAAFMLLCTGYYSYDRALEAAIPGLDAFAGTVAHPQWWPEDLDYAGKHVVIVGSGATTWTLFPTMAETAASVTVLQRSPSYVFALPSASPFDALLRRLLPLWLAHRLAAAKDLLLEVLFVGFLLTFPSAARSFLAKEAARQLPPGYPVDVHFNPSYKPWEQRLCISPDGDVFRALHRPNAAIVTDHIDAVVADGVRTRTGRHLPADVLVTATGLHMELLGGMALRVDGAAVDLAACYAWRGCMLEGVPNAAAVMGYVAGTWTPGADAVTAIALRVYAHMRAAGADRATPVVDLDPAERSAAPKLPVMDMKSNYFAVARSRLPMSMDRGPWYGRKNIVKDKAALWFGDVTTGIRYDGGKLKSV